MANAREIQERMKSIQDTMKITNAMYMISSTKLRKAKKELAETEPYFFTLQGMLARIIRHLPEVQQRFLSDEKEASGEKKKAFLVVTADKGLAGAYNHNVLKIAEEELEAETEEEPAMVEEEDIFEAVEANAMEAVITPVVEAEVAQPENNIEENNGDNKQE